MFTIELVGAGELVLRLDRMGSAVKAQLRRTVTALAIKLQAHIVRDKLHGQVLNQRSGALARSIQQVSPVEEGPGVYGRVFSAGDVKYARIQELGGKTPPHDIFPKNGKALKFFSMLTGETVFARAVHHPGSRIPARPYMSTSLADMAAEIEREMRLAVVRGLQRDAA